MRKKILKNLPTGKGYFQTSRDNGCGPLAMLYVADYIFKKKNQALLTAINWINGIRAFRGNNIWNNSLTNKKDLIKSIKYIGLKYKKISGDSYEKKLISINESIMNGNPVIISCLIKPYNETFPHYAVIVGIDHKGIYLHDPYPQKEYLDPYHIPNETFKSKFSIRTKTVWGRSRWGLEVFI